MKAEYSGTLAEQARFKAGWMMAAERKEKGIEGKCGDCASLEENHGAHCKKLAVATRVGCVCKHFEERSAKDF